MMKDMGSPMALWEEAVSTAAYCLNHTATSTNGGVTPIQVFEGIIPDISHMRILIFYTNAYIHQSKSQGAKKLGDCAHLVKFISYPEGVSGYKFYDLNTHTVILSCSPHFLEPPHCDSDNHPTNTLHPTDLNVPLKYDVISIMSDAEQNTHDSTPPSPPPSSYPPPPPP